MVPPPWQSAPISFREYMEHCLYHPVSGYYRSGRKIWGRRGDYRTSPHIHSCFARILANAIGARLRSLEGGDGPLDLVELGCGDGRLGREVLRSLAESHPDLSSRIRYTGVEIEEPALPSTIFGVVFSNEFFDALPVHRVRVRGGQLVELFVEHRDGRPSPIEAPLSSPEISDYMRVAFPTWREGYVYEVNLQMQEVLGRLAAALRAGAIFTIDYGYTWSQYDARERSEGTLLCYRRHQVILDPFEHPGEQDITAHISFELLMREGSRFGWTNVALQSQRDFLMNWGLDRILAEEEAKGLLNPGRLQDRLALKELLLPGGISDSLQVLIQQFEGTGKQGTR